MALETIKLKPQPNVYTVLVIVAILVLGLTVGLVLRNLLEPATPERKGYGLEFNMLLDHSKLPDPVKVQPK